MPAEEDQRSASTTAVGKLLAPARSLLRMMLRPAYRSSVMARWRWGSLAFQGVVTTKADRFPVLFRQCALLLRDVDSPRILSFGCASGEEAASLSAYMPSAKVVGVDINNWCLRQCRRRVRDGRCTFLHSHSREFAKCGAFDAIFCMAVFQRTEHRVKAKLPADTGFTFAVFDAEIAMLDAKLKPGGYFFIDHSDFSFEDASVAEHYAAVVFEGSARERHRSLFGRDDTLLADRHCLQRCFQKVR